MGDKKRNNNDQHSIAEVSDKEQKVPYYIGLVAQSNYEQIPVSLEVIDDLSGLLINAAINAACLVGNKLQKLASIGIHSNFLAFPFNATCNDFNHPKMRSLILSGFSAQDAHLFLS